MKKATLDNKVETCLKENALLQVKENRLDVVGGCGYGMPLPCKYQTSHQSKHDYFGCIYNKEGKAILFPEDYFES